VVLAQGELISTAMMNYYLQECGVKSVLLPALEYMRTDKKSEIRPMAIARELLTAARRALAEKAARLTRLAGSARVAEEMKRITHQAL
jgi:aspartokinase